MGRCAKQDTLAVIKNGNRIWTGTNSCKTPQAVCPRKDLPTGEGYEMCLEICGQTQHAEVQACEKAGDGADGATLYLFGHYYCCDMCKKVMDAFGIKEVVIIE